MSLPYFPMYPADFEADTSHLSLEEDGAYNRLLRLLWMSPDCTLPADPVWLARRMRIDAETYERVVAPLIAEFFKIEKARLFNPRLSRIRELTNETHKKRSEAGKRGGRPGNRLKTNEMTQSPAKAGPKQPEPEPEPEPEPDKRKAAAASRDTPAREPPPSPSPAAAAAASPPLVCSSAEEALGCEVQAILGANGDAWAWVGIHVHRWQQAGASADQIRAVARGLRNRNDATGRAPPRQPSYLDRIIADAVASAAAPMPQGQGPPGMAIAQPRIDVRAVLDRLEQEDRDRELRRTDP